MPSFLIDENLSPRLAHYFRKKGYAAKAVRELGLRGKSDEIILEYAKRKGVIIVTCDLEFGKFFYEQFGTISMIILRSRFQGIQGFIKILDNLHRKNMLRGFPPTGMLVLATINRIKMRAYPK